MMQEPRSLPAVRYYADGRWVLVETLAAFEALEPGHADHPDGPFPTPPAAGWEGPDAADLGPEARRRFVAGQSQQTIATALGVSRFRVRQWLKEEE